MMLTLQRPDPKVSALMGENKGIRDGDTIRPSIFAIPFLLGKRKVVFNTLTGHCIETELFSWFEDPGEFSYDEKDKEMKDLVDSDFLVAKDYDEVKKYTGLLSFIRRMEGTKPGFVGYTILPTTSCNARCFYCYEQGLKHETMSREIVEQTIEYILATRREDAKITLHWFGGEPLMGEEIIDRICERLDEADVDFSSSMISNGSLMTEDMAVKAKGSWHLDSIQITLDGREDVYEDRKRYVAFEGSPYKKVLSGIHAMLDQEIRVVIRLNVDEENLDELMLLVDELENEFEKESLVSMYCRGIFAVEGEVYDGDHDELYSGMERLNERIESFNRNRRERGNEDIDHYDRCGKLKRFYCMVDNPSTGPVILPDGKLTLCEHIGELPVVGTVFDETPMDREPYVERDRLHNEKCSHCGLLPVCTDFSGCPTVKRDCYRETLAKEKAALKTLENEKRLPPINMKIDGRIVRVIEPEAEYLEINRDHIVPYYLKPDEVLFFQCSD